MHLSPKSQVTGSILEFVLFYLMAQNSKWPSDKYEVEKALAILGNDTESEIIRGCWGQIKTDVNNEGIKVVSEFSSEQWHHKKHNLLSQIAKLESRNPYFSPDFLGNFVNWFGYSKFNGAVESVFDPAFGIGNLIFETFAGSRPSKGIALDDEGQEVEVDNLIAKKIEGIEINPRVCRLANTLGNILGFDINIESGNAFKFQKKELTKHKLVVCQPPFGLRIPQEFIQQDWAFGIPAPINADWAWAQIVYKYLSADGYGLLFIPRNALFKKGPNESLIRAKMISSGAIRAVINLPSNYSQTSRIPMSLIIFAGPEVSQKKSDEILLMSIPEPKGRPGDGQFHSTLHSSVYSACDVFHEFELGRFEPVAGYAAVVNSNDQSLINSNWNIDPSDYVTQRVSGIDSKFEATLEISNITSSIEELRKLASQAKANLDTFSIKANFTTIGDLLKSGKLVQVLGKTKNERQKEQFSRSVYENYLIVEDLRKSDLLEATGKIDWDLGSDKRPEIRTEPNDVVILKTGRPAAKVDHTGGKLLFSPLSVLRITDEGKKVLSSELLAFMLNGEEVKKFMRGMTVGRLDLENIPIPLLTQPDLTEINKKLKNLDSLIITSADLNEQLQGLDFKLSKVLWGELDGLTEDK